MLIQFWQRGKMTFQQFNLLLDTKPGKFFQTHSSFLLSGLFSSLCEAFSFLVMSWPRWIKEWLEEEGGVRVWKQRVSCANSWSSSKKWRDISEIPCPDCFTLNMLFSPSCDGSFQQILFLCLLCLASLKKSIGLGRWEGVVGGFFLDPLSLGGKKLGGVLLHLFSVNPRVLTPYQGCYFNASYFLCPLLGLCALTICTHRVLYCGVSPNALWLPRHIKSSVCYSSSCGPFQFFFKVSSRLPASEASEELV